MLNVTLITLEVLQHYVMICWRQ